MTVSQHMVRYDAIVAANKGQKTKGPRPSWTYRWARRMHAKRKLREARRAHQ